MKFGSSIKSKLNVLNVNAWIFCIILFNFKKDYLSLSNKYSYLLSYEIPTTFAPGGVQQKLRPKHYIKVWQVTGQGGRLLLSLRSCFTFKESSSSPHPTPSLIVGMCYFNHCHIPPKQNICAVDRVVEHLHFNVVPLSISCRVLRTIPLTE